MSSIRAYRVIKIETAQGESFNLNHDDDLVGFINNRCDFIDGLNADGAGLFDVPLVVLKQAIGEVQADYDVAEDEEIILNPTEYVDLKLSKGTIAAIKADIAFAEKEGDDYVTYYAY